MDKYVRQHAMEEGREEGREKGREEGLKEGLKEGRKEGWKEGRKKGVEEGRKEGIEALILDNLEEGKTKQQIIEKLINRFALDEKDAVMFTEKYINHQR